jgi:hypothetical protein
MDLRAYFSQAPWWDVAITIATAIIVGALAAVAWLIG